ncbi:MAG: outer membrane protein assembly factor BamE, partial [Pseudomonadota bacterium]
MTNPLKKIRLLLIALVSGHMLAACGAWWLPPAHKIDIQQGNILSDDTVARITTGMSRVEIENLLGKPVAETGGGPDRWDYIYSLNKAGKRPDAKR